MGWGVWEVGVRRRVVDFREEVGHQVMVFQVSMDIDDAMVTMYFIIICYEGCGVVWYLNIFADGFDRQGKG